LFETGTNAETALWQHRIVNLVQSSLAIRFRNRQPIMIMHKRGGACQNGTTIPPVLAASRSGAETPKLSYIRPTCAGCAEREFQGHVPRPGTIPEDRLIRRSSRSFRDGINFLVDPDKSLISQWNGSGLQFVGRSRPTVMCTVGRSHLISPQACRLLTPTSPSSRDLTAATAAMLPAAVVK
jgi:hypothetical protein